MQDIIKMYERKEVDELFNEDKLCELLLSSKGIHKKKKVISGKKQLFLDDDQDKVYFIVEGIVSVEKREEILYFVGKNHFIGLENILFHKEQMTEMNTIGNVEFIEFKKFEIVSLLMGLQEGWLYAYLINQNIYEKMLVNLGYYHLRPIERSKKMLIALVEDFGEKQGNHFYLQKEFTYGILTKYLGISYVTMKKIVEVMQEENISFGYSQRNYVLAD